MDTAKGCRGGSASRVLSACVAVVVLLYSSPARPDEMADGVAAPCVEAAEVTRVAPTEQGLLVETNVPVSPRIEVTRAGDESFGEYTEVRVDIPNATSKLSLAAQLSVGPFIAIRGVRYRTATECGLRLRITSKIVANWRVELVRSGFVIIAAVAEVSADAESAMLGGSAAGRQPGALGFRAMHSISNVGGDSQHVDSVQIGFAQRMRDYGTLRGFFSDIHPHDLTAAPYGAIGVADAPAGNTRIDAAAGDLAAVWGTTGLATTSAINTLMFRGAGGNVLLPRNISLLGFHGRAAASLFSRLHSGEIVTDISQDRITGIEGAWSDPLDRYGFGIGWVRSAYLDDGTQDNFVQSFEERWNGGTSSLRSSLEESRGASGSGAAFTIEPRANVSKLSVNGFLRYLSRNFRPPLGSNYFATLRRSYGLSAAYEPIQRLTLSTNLAQTKTFELYDPENAGTLTMSKNVSANYLLTDRSGVSAFYGESELKSDPGVLLQSDSRSRSEGAGGFVTWRRMNADVRISRDETTNRSENRIELRETVVEGDLSHIAELTDVYAHIRFAAVDQSASNPEGYRDFSSILSADRQLTDRLAVHGEVGYSERPPGTTLLGFREEHATIGIRTGPRYSPFSGNIQVGYSRASSGGSPASTGWIFSAGVGDLLQWGRGRSRPLPPFDSRAMNIQQTDRRAHIATLAIDVFVDTNQNGTHDAGEQGLPRAELEVDALRVRTGRSGIAALLVHAGDHTVRIQPAGAMLDYYIRNEKTTVTVRENERREVAFALQPAGRVVGRVSLSPGLEDRAFLSSIRINLKNDSIDLSAITDGDGNFTIGLVPAGTYTVNVDPTTLSPEVAVEGAEKISVQVKAGVRAEVTFTLRKATARERFGIPPANGGRSHS